MYNKLILLSFLIILSDAYAQDDFSNEINKIDSLVTISDSLVDNYKCTVRKFSFLSYFDILIEPENFKFDSTFFKWHILDSTYLIFYDLDKIPFLFIAYAFNEFGNCELIHKYYFDSGEKTIFYNFNCNRFDATILKQYKKQVNTYFNAEFDLIKVIEKYDSNEIKNMNDSDRFEVIDQYDNNMEYKSNLQTILSSYKIKL